MSGPVSRTVVPGLGVVTVAPLDVSPGSEELAVLHGWVGEERARFWGMVGKSAEEVDAIYRYLDSLETHHAFWVRLDGRPVALLQTYQPEHDPVGECYDVQPGDLGMHLLQAPPESGAAPVPGFTELLGTALAGHLFADPGVQRLVVEPDSRNDRALARLERTGFELGPEIRLPDKTARLAFLPRRRLQALLRARDLSHSSD
ncbi:N-acetyltransferase [Desertihabitans brevis]|uniref:Lysine N-acyltransferase MbtK n=1 Tax=Desertihabitans brevis TaxID=2268447 RepID=A0A367YVD3_9ACTN|nr:GNAT family N-acetyltransferase [Desertihabitans brevis]RCK69770.1 N-acetyltransferase [Desertihabitans brevis]